MVPSAVSHPTATWFPGIGAAIFASAALDSSAFAASNSAFAFSASQRFHESLQRPIRRIRGGFMANPVNPAKQRGFGGFWCFLL